MTRVGTPQAWELTSRFVGNVVKAAGGDAAVARGVERTLSAHPDVVWRSSAAVGATAGVHELRHALPATGLEPALRARVDAVLQLVGSGDEGLTPAMAGRALGAEDSSTAGVQAALRRRGFEAGVVAAADGSTRRRTRIPSLFVEERSLASLVQRASETRSSTIDPKRALLLGAIGVGTAAVGARALFGGPGDDTSAAAEPEERTGNSIAGAKGELQATHGIDAQRDKIAQAAIDQIGERDINANGTLGTTVKSFKASVTGGLPNDAGARWEASFASWAVTSAGGVKIGADGRGDGDVVRLHDWATATGHARDAADTKRGLVPGNLVFIERKSPSGGTWHDVGVIAGPSKTGDGWVMVAGGRLDGSVAKVKGTPQYVGTVGWEVIHPGDTLGRNGRRIEGYLDPLAKPLPRDPNAGPVLYNTGDRDLGNVTPNQYRDGKHLTYQEGSAACGPTAAVAFARYLGREITLDHAAAVGRTVGWTEHGMQTGPTGELRLIRKLGIKAHLEWGTPDWKKVQARLKAGVPVIIDTPGHYWVAERYDPKTKRYDFGASGKLFGRHGNNPWFTVAEMTKFGQGKPRATIFLDKQK